MTPGNLNSGVTAISAGQTHACAIANGQVWCWGSNKFGQLGNGSTENEKAPVQVAGLPGPATHVTVGNAHSCAIVDAEIYCWGSRRFLGQTVQAEGTAQVPTPLKVTSLEKAATGIAAGSMHTCAIVSGAVWCWGQNTEGQLGNGSNQASNVPVQAKDLVRATQIAANDEHSCAIIDSEVNCWGANRFGELGVGGMSNSNMPLKIQGLPAKPEQIELGSRHACALSGGNTWCWGENKSGQLARNKWATLYRVVKALFLSEDAMIMAPAQADEPIGDTIALGAGEAHTCSLAESGQVTCWGINEKGELGKQFQSKLQFGRGTGFSSEPINVTGLN